MGITYNKKDIIKNRRLMTTGPRDMQRKNKMGFAEESQAELIKEFKEQVRTLQDKLSQEPRSNSGLFTPEQVDDEIIKAVQSETSSLKIDYERKIKKIELENVELKNEIIRLKEKIDSKDELIQQLKETPTIYDEKDDDRPQIETVFVDPLERVEKEVESYITVEDVTPDQKEDMFEKVGRLKELIGDLPNK